MVFEYYTGYADLEKQKKIGPDTLFRIYSMTRLFTCAAVMQLYEKGTFQLMDPEKKVTAVYMEQSTPSLEPYIAPRLRNMIYASL